MKRCRRRLRLLVLLALMLTLAGCAESEYADQPEDEPAYEQTYDDGSSSDGYVDGSSYDEESDYAEEPSESCDPSYPEVCIPADVYDLDCAEVGESDFSVEGDDPHGFDGDGDGIGCESYDDSAYDDSGYYDDSSEHESGEYGDLDCADVSGPVVVPPGDPDGLDGDGDGIGCEG